MGSLVLKLIAYYRGTDALLLSRFPPSKKSKYLYFYCHRLLAKVIDIFVSEYHVDDALLANDLIKWGTQKKIYVRPDFLKYKKTLPKEPHYGFNVLYYYPKNNNPKMWEWIYGYDIYKSVRDILKNEVNWIIVDGNQDMTDIFPITDFYLRPNRHDGASRLRRECGIQKIPYYWSQENPDIGEAVEAIRKAKSTKNLH
jgi:hypothetical protein